MNHTHEIIFAGFGGQGVMFAGQLLSYAAMRAGLHVTWIPSYGPEMRGGTANCTVVISNESIGSPVVQNPEIAIVFNNPSYEKYEPLVAAGGLLVVNCSLVARQSVRNDIDVLYIPATQMAEHLGNSRVANLVLIGGMLSRNGLLPEDALQYALQNHIPEHRRDLLNLNQVALRAGLEYSSDLSPAT